jgi:hypothetical protein
MGEGPVRLRLGVAMASKGGRTALVGAEVRQRRATSGRLEYDFTVGLVERVHPATVEAARARVAAVMESLADVRPCCIVDVGTAQGLALRQALRGAYKDGLHRPHAYPGHGERVELFAAFLQAYSTERVRFEPGLSHRADLDRALVFYMGGGVGKDGVELASEDEALVVALGLAMFWPGHGQQASAMPAAAVQSAAR